jgi:serine/threonine protein kinase
MAPEVFRHEPYNEKVDTYSFAMLMYFLTAGHAPWPMLNGVSYS